MSSMLTDNSRHVDDALPVFTGQTILILLGMLLLGSASFAIDMQVIRWVRHAQWHRWLIDLIQNAEPFGHAAGVALVIITTVVLDCRGCRLLGPLLITAYGGGMWANLVKLLLSRTRPRGLTDFDISVWETFGDVLGGIGTGKSQSFPSAHTATAVALATILSAIYPRGRSWFYFLATLVAIQRIVSMSHYPSDVWFGAAVGWCWGNMCMKWFKSLTSLS